MPDDPSPAVRLANTEAFKQAQAAMKSPGQAWGHPLFVPSGTFYLADDLHISKSLELFGTGVQGESILMFPAIVKITNESIACLTTEGISNEIIEKVKSLFDKEFLDQEESMKAIGELIGDDAAAANRAQILKCSFFRGTSLIIDPGNVEDPASDGAECVIHDLQLISEENWTFGELDSPFDPSNFDPPTLEGTSKGTPGIRMHRTAGIQRVYVKGFTGSGIYIIGGSVFNANQWRIHDVYINACGGHGIHVEGEAQGGLCTGAKIIGIGGSGIYQSSGGGNTCVGCYVE